MSQVRSMLRFSLGTLMLVTALVAVGFAALANATPLWAQAVVTGVATSLIGTSVVAVYSRQARPFAGGFSLAGWAYFMLTASGLGVTSNDNLITTTALTKLYPLMHETDHPGALEYFLAVDRSASMRNTSLSLAGLQTVPASTPLTRFHSIGHALWTLVIACLGGTLAVFIRRRAVESSSV